MKDYDLENRRLVLSAVAIGIVVIYVIRLFALQIASDDYRKSADSNAFLKKIEFPSRGSITDRKGRLLVYNQPAYDIMVVTNEMAGHLDTLEFCRALNITKADFINRMLSLKDRNKNPGYSRFTQQLFLSQLSDKEFSAFQEKLYRFPGFYIQKRSVRQYQRPIAAHVLGDVAEVSQSDIEEDDYYQPGDYIGKMGVNTKRTCGDARACRYCSVMPMGRYRDVTRTASTTSIRAPAVTCSSVLMPTCRHSANG